MADLWNTATTHSPAPLRPSETFPSQCHISSPGDDDDENDEGEDDEDDVAACYNLLMIIG